MDNEFVHSVKRKSSAAARPLQFVMIVLAVLFLLAGIMLDRGFMLSCFLMAGLYYVYRTFSNREYEYILKDRTLCIDRIYGGTIRRRAVEADLEDLVVLAPHDAQEVAPWRKGGIKKAKKMDFTSYDDHVPYYTMILQSEGETWKLLLELTEDMLQYVKYIFPERVHRSFLTNMVENAKKQTDNR